MAAAAPPGGVEVQLELDLDYPRPSPRLVAGAPDPQPLAQLGHVLAQVLAFHEAFDLPRQPLPAMAMADLATGLRVRLLREEVEEFALAVDRGDLVAAADALADVVYVAYGSAVTYGIDLDAVVSEVHRANMSKLDGRGRPVLRKDGKVLKSARYRPPDVSSVLDQQLPLFDPDKSTLSSSAVAG